MMYFSSAIPHRVYLVVTTHGAPDKTRTRTSARLATSNHESETSEVWRVCPWMAPASAQLSPAQPILPPAQGSIHRPGQSRYAGRS